jgi:hypothetical protein
VTLKEKDAAKNLLESKLKTTRHHAALYSVAKFASKKKIEREVQKVHFTALGRKRER